MTWFKVDDKLWGNEKWVAAGKGARALWTAAGTWSAFQMTDGHIPAHILPILRATRAEALELAKVGLWHAHGHECKRCEQPHDPKGWIFHDWADFQPDAASEDVRRDSGRKAMSEAGGMGNHLRWHANRGITVPACPHCTPDHEPDENTSGDPNHPRIAPESGSIAPSRPDPDKKTRSSQHGIANSAEGQEPDAMQAAS